MNNISYKKFLRCQITILGNLQNLIPEIHSLPN